jgi:hypothetical protein
MLQFGSRYRNPRHFKHRFLRYLRRVIDYYPEARPPLRGAAHLSSLQSHSRPSASTGSP